MIGHDTAVGGTGRRAPGRLFGAMGAVTSLALVAGMGVWSVDLATRDAQGVPVIKAMTGPARSAPDNPGGFEAAHKGLAVNSVVAENDDTPLADRVVLAPDPIRPEADDAPVAQASATMPSDDGQRIAHQAAQPDPDAAMRDAVDGALRDILGGASSVSDDSAAAQGAAATPQQRPTSRVASRAASDRPATAIAASTGSAGAATIDAGDIPPGTRLVQLGTFGSADAARDAWSTLAGDFSDYLDDKARVIEPVAADGADMVRLRAHGFTTLASARNLCSVLIAAHSDCIPVLTR